MEAADRELRGHALLPGSSELVAASVVLHGDHIAAVRPASGSVPDVVVSPGFVDLQVNGVGEVDAWSAVGADWDRAAVELAAAGVTAWLPTLVTRALDRYADALERIRPEVDRHGPGAVVVGVHLEGPFLGNRPGAHPPDRIVAVDQAWIDGLPPLVRLVTMGPEQGGVPEATAKLAARGVVVSMGHSAADAATSEAMIDAGATMATHLFNAMGPLGHRSPGLAGVALTDDRVTVGLIADLVHVDARMLRLAFRAKAPGRVVLVTDQVAWRSPRLLEAGIRVVDGAPRLGDGTIAGSALVMDQAIRHVVDQAGIPLVEALVAATTTPARIIGDQTRGTIAVGARADLVVLDRDALAPSETLVAGQTVWER